MFNCWASGFDRVTGRQGRAGLLKESISKLLFRSCFSSSPPPQHQPLPFPLPEATCRHEHCCRCATERSSSVQCAMTSGNSPSLRPCTKNGRSLQPSHSPLKPHFSLSIARTLALARLKQFRQHEPARAHRASRNILQRGRGSQGAARCCPHSPRHDPLLSSTPRTPA